ncbi:MAG: thermonuclease family protein [Bauldia sp.]
MNRLLATVLLVFLAGPAAAQYVTGNAVATDGDSLRIDGERIRLYGVAAPELDRSCAIPGGGEWKCGAASRDFLASLVALGPVYCVGVELDQYGRLLAECDAYDGRSINETMVLEGMAWAFVRYADDYLAEEEAARAAGRGVWRTD